MTHKITVDASHLTVLLPEDHDPTKPFPLTIERDFDNPNCWATGDGKKVFRDREWAEKSMEMETDGYKEHWRKRAEFSRLVKAEVVSPNAMIYSDDVSGSQDGYFHDIGDLIDQCECDELPIPAYCFATSEQAFDFDIFDAIENYLNDQHHEEAHDQINGWSELETFWKAWASKQTLRSYFVDYSKVVVIDQGRFAAAVAEAKAWLAENVQL